MINWIIDTNVVVGSLLAAGSKLPIAGILSNMKMGAFKFLLSDALLAEYRTVLLRPALIKRHALRPTQIEDLLAELLQNAIMQTPVSTAPAPDSNDQHLWELLAAKPDSILVTEDKLLLTSAYMRKRVYSVQKFLQTR